jgi:hypothetical protein
LGEEEGVLWRGGNEEERGEESDGEDGEGEEAVDVEYSTTLTTEVIQTFNTRPA